MGCYQYQVPFLLVVLLLASCHSRVQENSCQIQSYIRKLRGSSAGNLLRVHLNANGTKPVAISFNGTCNDSNMLTKFILSRKHSKGKLVVNILWEKDRDFALAIRAGLLVIERAKISSRHVFHMMDTPKNCFICRVAFKSLSGSPLYMMTDIAGLPRTGRNPSQRGTWYDVKRTFCGV